MPSSSPCHRVLYLPSTSPVPLLSINLHPILNLTSLPSSLLSATFLYANPILLSLPSTSLSIFYVTLYLCYLSTRLPYQTLLSFLLHSSLRYPPVVFELISPSVRLLSNVFIHLPEDISKQGKLQEAFRPKCGNPCMKHSYLFLSVILIHKFT